MRTAVVSLVNFNGLKNRQLLPCLESLERGIGFASRRNDFAIRVLLTDGNSTDESYDELKRFKNRIGGEVEVRRLGANRGPIATIDRGLQFVLKDFGEADYVITLDEDVSLRPDFLVEFVRKADRTPSDVGMIASNQFCLDAHHRGLHRSTGHYVTRAGAAMDRGFHLRKAPKRPAILCPCLSGALFKMELLKDLGGICTDYYQYYGCIEFGFRAQLSGWRCEFAELAKMRHWGRVRHLHGKSLAIREISRVWSIFSFFPKQVVPKALETYRLECRDFSPLKRAAFIQEAERSLPQIWDDEEMKNRVYHNFVEPNEPKAPCPCER